MEDKLVEMLVSARREQNITCEALCQGICTKDMYSKVERGDRVLDRIAIKRLLARLGVDNGSYEKYLEYTDYIVWKIRMDIINAIEKGELLEAEKLLEEYCLFSRKSEKNGRDNLQQQFCTFMELQIIRHRDEQKYEGIACEMYKSALKCTVPSIDETSLDKILLSTVEFIIAVEYKRRKKAFESVEELWEMYEKFFRYIEHAPYGNSSMTKVYPKLVVCLYEDIRKLVRSEKVSNIKETYEKLLRFCDEALLIIKQRKKMFYFVELMEMVVDIRQQLKEYLNDASKIKECECIVADTQFKLKTIKELYEEYKVSPYLLDDCYIYRESGIYCIPDVIRVRRGMMNVTQKMLAGDLCDVKTLSRGENGQVAVQTYIFKELFRRLGLYPDYINMGIVTGNKEVVELYEEIRFAANSYKLDDVDKLLVKLKKKLKNNIHPINEQVLALTDTRNKWLTKRIEAAECMNILQRALNKTINLEDVFACDGQIFLTTREVNLIHQMSLIYNESGQHEDAYKYIKKIWDSCKEWEKEGLEDGRIAIYELIMSYMSSLLGDLRRFDEANEVADKLIRISLRMHRFMIVHQSIYDKAWNNNESKKQGFDYKCELNRCICIAGLIGDTNDELFYKNQLTSL